jgi:exodeoxyribonuclease VII large subunit
MQRLVSEGPANASRYSGEATYTVAQLTSEIRDFLAESFAYVWVAGEVQRRRSSRRGHLYFELVEKGAGDRIVGKLDAVLWRSSHLRVSRRLAASGQEIADGQEIRCLGRLDFYGPAGRLQLIVSDVDPLFTLGLLERRRRETLAALTAAGLLERNRRLELPALPLRLGLVTSEGSAAYHDFLAGLAENGYGFRVLFAHAAVQGREAEAEVASALRILSGFGDRLDAVVVIRGGGSRSDLAAFDSRRIVEAIARCPLPVLTGLGHEIDRSIADLVSHSAFKTPTKVAEFLVARVSEAERRLDGCAAALGRSARRAIRKAGEELRRFERLPRSAELLLQAAGLAVADSARALDLLSRRRLREAGRGLDRAERRLAASAPRLLSRWRRAPEILLRRLADVARGRLREARAVVEGIARLSSELAPERLLERGYSITRDESGKILKQPRQVRPGEAILTELAGGVLRSRVEEP